MPSRTGELLYALGNVAHKQASFLGQPYLDKSLEHYEKALLHFQRAVPDTCSAAGMAKTHYKLALHSLRSRDHERATYESYPGGFRKALMRLLDTTSMERCRSTPAAPFTPLTSVGSISNGAEFRP